MDNNFDLGIIKIPLSIFKDVYENQKDSTNETLHKKAKELINNYNCFVSNYDAKSLWEKKKIMAAQKKTSRVNSNNRTRPFVLLIDLNDDIKYKKEFTSFLNKLTDINKETIYNKISLFINVLDEPKLNSLFDILINFIKVSSNSIYIDVLYLFPENYVDYHVTNFCNSFLNNNQWLPDKEFIIDNKKLYHNDNYDNYCKFVKTKKQTISILKALIHMNKKLEREDFLQLISSDIINSIDTYIENNEYKHITEFLLDEISYILEIVNDKKIIHRINNYDLSILDYSTKFKIMKIIENNETMSKSSNP